MAEPQRPGGRPALSGGQQNFLDAVRITAAGMVLLGHGFFLTDLTAFAAGDRFPLLQDLGVVIFFLLSGFLTASSLERRNARGDDCFRDFFLHKLGRIMKEYIPALLLIALLDAVSIRCNPGQYRYYDTYNLKTFLGNLLFLQWTAVNRLPGVQMLAFGSGKPLWTLSLEWYFYLLFARVFLAIRNREKLGLWDMALLGVLLLFPYEYLIGGRGGGLGCVFALGVLGYYFYGSIERRAAPILFAGSLVALLGYGCLRTEAYAVIPFLLLWLALCAGVRTFSGGRGRNRFTAYLSGSTFMLYLLHWTVFELLIRLELLLGNLATLLLGTALSLLCAILMYEFFGRRELLYAVLPKRKKGRG